MSSSLHRRGSRPRWIAGTLTVAIAALALVGIVFVSPGHGAPKPVTDRPVTKGPKLESPSALAVTPTGNILISNRTTNQILELSRTNKLSILAGNGKAGFSGTNGPSKQAELNHPGGLAVAPDGTVYFADTANNRIRRISSKGVISTVAYVVRPVDVALDSGGALYIADSVGIQVVSPSGKLSTLIATHTSGTVIAGQSIPLFPSGVAVSSNGHLYVSLESPKALVEYSMSGVQIRSWQTYASLAGITADASGGILVADYGNFAVDHVQNSVFSAVHRFSPTDPKISGFRPSGIAVGADGQVLVSSDGLQGGVGQVISLSPSGNVRVLAAA